MRAALGMLALVCAACVPARWDVDELASRHAGLRAVSGHRLGDSMPYLLAREGELVWFLCRWVEDAIPVSFPPDATAAELEVLEAALRAWEGAGLGLRFERRDDARGTGIAIRFFAQESAGRGRPQAANTAADCGVRPSGGEQLDARLVFASIFLHRSGLDTLGREVAHTHDELAGAAAHELGHALGFQGHARRGPGVMVRTTEEVRRAGRRLLAGEGLRDPTLRALYALPSGTVVARREVGAAQTQAFDRLFALAAERDWAGPLARVGEQSARVAWLGPDGDIYRLFVLDVGALWRGAGALEVVPDRAAAAALAGSR